jgi:ribonuclease Z
MENKACVAQHSTAWMAGQFAWAIKAKSLVLTHFSARYEGSQRDTAKATFGAAGGTGYVSEGENEERAHQALKREADDQYGLGPVLLAIDLLSAHVRKPGEAEDASA